MGRLLRMENIRKLERFIPILATSQYLAREVHGTILESVVRAWRPTISSVNPKTVTCPCYLLRTPRTFLERLP
jgi:hypothetical protein